MRAAAEWLDVNEGDNGEMAACHRVAEWLRNEATRQDNNDQIRRVAREHGVSTKLVREAVRLAKRTV